jgi:hypothetical protein
VVLREKKMAQPGKNIIIILEAIKDNSWNLHNQLSDFIAEKLSDLLENTQLPNPNKPTT